MYLILHEVAVCSTLCFIFEKEKCALYGPFIFFKFFLFLFDYGHLQDCYSLHLCSVPQKKKDTKYPYIYFFLKTAFLLF